MIWKSKVLSGYPPDILHILEGVVPTEVSLCLTDLIGKSCFTLDVLNWAIRFFRHTFSDRTDQPWQGIFHQSDNWWKYPWELVSRKAPYTYYSSLCPWGWQHKDIVELAVAPRHTEETWHFLDYKIAEHRLLLQLTFPDFCLRPLHSAFQKVWSPVWGLNSALWGKAQVLSKGKSHYAKLQKCRHDTCDKAPVGNQLAPWLKLFLRPSVDVTGYPSFALHFSSKCTVTVIAHKNTRVSA